MGLVDAADTRHTILRSENSRLYDFPSVALSERCPLYSALSCLTTIMTDRTNWQRRAASIHQIILHTRYMGQTN